MKMTVSFKLKENAPLCLSTEHVCLILRSSPSRGHTLIAWKIRMKTISLHKTCLHHPYFCQVLPKSENTHFDLELSLSQ